MSATAAESTLLDREMGQAALPVLLMATDQLPYPPRNGITLPFYNYLMGLQAHYQLRLVLFVDADHPPDPQAWADNEARFGAIVQVPLRRRSKWRRLAGELRGAEMFQHGYQLAAAALPTLPAAERLLISPMSAVAKWRSSGLAAVAAVPLAVAALNDCTAAEYYFRGSQSFGGWKGRLKGLLDRLRTPLVARVEARLLQPYQHLLLQTQTDADLMGRLVSSELARRVQLAPNGVRLDYFELTPAASSRQIVFVAELSGEYAAIAHWLVQEVWPLVAAGDADCRLLMVGKGASPALQQAIASAQRVAHVSFVPDLTDVYGQSMMALSPVFKGFGLINKTLEAMAAGLPVVGGVAAFNGIAEFRDRHNGIAAPRTTQQFAQAILSLSQDSERRRQVGLAGRAAVASQFRWETTVAAIHTLLQA
jgi:glycosyltransferase involved in cell wall biosynthesis